MYCKKCGYDNPKEALYCLNDGVALLNIKESYHYTSASSKFCSSCGAENEKHLIYCSQCGNSLLKIKKSSSDVEKLIATTTTTKNIPIKDISSIASKFELEHFKKSLAGALTSLVILFVIAMIIGTSISEEINMLYAEPLLNEFGLRGYIKEFQLITGTDIILLVNLIGSKLNLLVSEGHDIFSGTLSISYGFYSFLILPFLALATGGYITGRKNPNASIKERFFLSLATGGIYTIFLLIVSILSRTSIEIPLFFGGDSFIKFTINYSILNSLLHGIVFGTLFSFIGSLVQLSSFKSIKSVLITSIYGESVYQGIFTVLKGIVLSSFIMFFFLLNTVGDEIFDEFFILFLIVGQLGAYFWNMLNLGSFTLSLERLHQMETFKASIFSGTEDLMYILPVSDNFNVYLYLALLIPIALFIWAGKNIKASSSGNLIHEILVFSGVYSLLTSFLIFITNFNVTGSGQLFSYDFMGSMRLSVGFNSFAVLFSTFIFSFVITYLGTIIFNNKANISY